jgi:putative two-component system response regulator
MVGALPDSRILLVDDERVNTVLLSRVLANAGWRETRSLEDAREALDVFRGAEAAGNPFDLVCVDLHMPFMSGLDVIRALRRETAVDDFVPILVFTADETPAAEQGALAAGANDFVTKPFRASQVVPRVGNLLRMRALHSQLRDRARHLEDLVKERTIELEAARLDVLDRLAAAAEYRDYATGRHTQRVGVIASLVAAELGLDAETVDLIRRAAPLHDVGKIGVPDTYLLKPGKLTPAEFETMKGHVELGARLLAEGQSKLIAMAELIAWTHHERWDGSGYPKGLAGDDIPMVGQIVAVADVFDTLINERPYKAAWPLERAIAEIRSQRGRWFSEGVVDAFLAVLTSHPDLVAELRRVSEGVEDGGLLGHAARPASAEASH